jgi:hypothetical protein
MGKASGLASELAALLEPLAALQSPPPPRDQPASVSFGLSYALLRPPVYMLPSAVRDSQ